MLKSILSRTTVALAAIVLASAVHATPINFAIAGASGTFSGMSFGSTVDVSASANLPQQFQLDVGQSHTFEFLDVTVSGIGVAMGNIDAALNFADPSSTAVGQLGGFAAILGFASAGVLTVLDQPNTIAFGDGGLFDVRFSGAQGSCMFCDSISGTIMATVELLKAPGSVAVPEPATLTLLGLGLLSLVLLRRRSA